MTSPHPDEDRLTEMSEAWTDDQRAYRSWAQVIKEVRLDNLMVTLAHAEPGKNDEAANLN